MKKELLKIKKSTHIIFFSLLFFALLMLFRRAFTMNFILDDFFFLRISHPKNLLDFLYFFSPFKNFFYRPLSTEVYYTFINVTGENIFIGHILAFIIFFLGLYFLFKVLMHITKNKKLSYLIVFMYSFHFTHVFQLYALNTFQELCLFTFLILSFYFFLKGKNLISILFFICALMSKENALMFPIFPILFLCFNKTVNAKKNIFIISLYIFLSILFLIIYSRGISHVEAIDIYTLQANPRLIINNAIWYLLWSLGVPNFVPNYVSSILLKPLPDFWIVLKAQSILWYFYALLTYYILFFGMLLVLLFYKVFTKRFWVFAIVLFLSFFVFLVPVLPIIHRWMVRLTLPLLFLVIFQAVCIYKAYIIGKLPRIFAIVLVLIYIPMQVLGTSIHESSGLYLLESNIVQRAQDMFVSRKDEIQKKNIVYFADTNAKPLGGSKKLKVTFHGEDFLYYFFPGSSLRAIYAFEHESVPKNSYIIISDDFIK